MSLYGSNDPRLFTIEACAIRVGLDCEKMLFLRKDAKRGI